MECIECQQEIPENQKVVFLFGDGYEPYPICKKCLSRLLKDKKKRKNKNAPAAAAAGVVLLIWYKYR